MSSSDEPRRVTKRDLTFFPGGEGVTEDSTGPRPLPQGIPPRLQIRKAARVRGLAAIRKIKRTMGADERRRINDEKLARAKARGNPKDEA